MTTTTQTYSVTGMTCDHCARAVTAELDHRRRDRRPRRRAHGHVRVTAGRR